MLRTTLLMKALSFTTIFWCTITHATTPNVSDILDDGNVVASHFFLDHGYYNFILLVQYERKTFVCETLLSDSRVWGEPGTIKCIEQEQLPTTTRQYVDD